MNDAVAQPAPLAARRQRSIYQVHYALPRRTEMARPWPPRHVAPYGAQVAGHGSEQDHQYLGLLQCSNGTILKPILKEAQQREVAFYQRLAATQDPDLLELKALVPRFLGCRRYKHQGHELQYIELEDLTERMLEPCIIDVKIGKRTWDPLATEAKIAAEQSKYRQCRQEFCFCIPGFQVYRLASGQLQKYGKDYGKKLHGHMVKEAIRNFLNGVGGAALCRALLLQFLAALWPIQRWAARARRLRIYSASLLLAYDARRLRDCCGTGDLLDSPNCRPPATARRPAPAAGGRAEPPGASFSGQLGARGPVFRKVNSVPLTSIALAQQSFGGGGAGGGGSAWSAALDSMNRLHSFDHNYEDKLSKIRLNYRATLDQLANDDASPSLWGSVKVIDFAHAFFNDEEEAETVDDNFRDGIDRFVAIFEELLKETDDQVF